MHATMKIHPDVGLGLRAPHLDELLDTDAGPTWLEVHSENWFAATGPLAERLAAIGEKYDLSLHGVGLSLGSCEPLDNTHLHQLRALIERCNPVLVSEHLSWGAADGKHSNDLLPLPYTLGNVRLLAERIDQVQQFLGRGILVENLSSYCTFAASTMPEWEFIHEIVARAHCGLLLDINNVYVNASNHGFDAADYLGAMPWNHVHEVHLAGYESWNNVLIDTHGAPVQVPVWTLFADFWQRFKPGTRVLIEWDSDLPALSVLRAEAVKASQIMNMNPMVPYA